MVTLVRVQGPRADPLLTARFAAFRRNHWQWGGQPGNYALMVKQGFCVNEAIRVGRRLGLEWLFHLDVDELFLPELPRVRCCRRCSILHCSFGGAAAGSSSRRSFFFAFQPPVEHRHHHHSSFLRRHCGRRLQGLMRVEDVLRAVPESVSSVRFLNSESVPESTDTPNRFADISLFKVRVLPDCCELLMSMFHRRTACVPLRLHCVCCFHKKMQKDAAAALLCGSPFVSCRLGCCCCCWHGGEPLDGVLIF